jgi:hypothetical protein
MRARTRGAAKTVTTFIAPLSTPAIFRAFSFGSVAFVSPLWPEGCRLRGR